MMTLAKIGSSLRGHVLGATFAAMFRDAFAVHPTLCRYRGMDEALRDFPLDGDERTAERDLVTSFFIAEFQQTRNAAWSSALVVAYLPMLTGLRSTLKCKTHCADDLDQLVLTSFLDVVAHYPLEKWGERCKMHLRQETTRAVVAELEREQKHYAPFDRAIDVDEDELTTEGWSATDRVEIEQLLQSRMQNAGVSEYIELVRRVALDGQSISSYVAELYPNASPAERKRIRACLKQRYLRAIERLREHARRDVVVRSRARTEPNGLAA